MIRNYLKIAWRNIYKNKVFSFINVFGLAIGLTCCFLIALFLIKEVSYDKHHNLGNRLYQIGTISIQDGIENRFATTPGPMVAAMQQEFPDVESTVRLMKLFQDDKTLLKFQNGINAKSFFEANGYAADSTFFRLFTYTFTEGNPVTALDHPNSVVLSEEIATKIFGKEPALNKVIHINSTTNGAFDFTITGVYKPTASSSHIDARFLISMQSGEIGPWVRSLNGMVNNNLFYSYLLLKPGVDPKKLEAKFDDFIKKYAGEDLKSSGRGRKQFLTGIADIHLFAETEGNVTAGGSVNYLYILLTIAIVTLLIACVNFMNLSTARSSKRATEIGVRKVMGANKVALIRQFLWEAVLLSLIGFILSIILAFILLPLFEQVSGKDLSFSTEQYLGLFFVFLLITIIAGFFAGIYPAFYLSSFKPIKVLKGKITNSLAAISFRKVLVVFQFVIAVALIIASITISNQMQFLRSQDLGFQKEQQVILPLRSSTAKEIYPELKNALLSNSSIAGAGASIYYPGIENVTDWLLYKQGTPTNQLKTVFMNRVDDSYLQTMGFHIIAGRPFSKNFSGDTANRIVLNERAIKDFGFSSPEDAIGKSIAATRDGQEVLFPIVGVVKDFHFKGFQSTIQSYGFLLDRQPVFSYLIVHVNDGNVKASLDHIAATWSKLNPNEPFEYSFLDQDFQKNYVAEERLAAIIRYFTIIAILISCLGLFGLTSFSVEQRTKEIGIRKVLGASTRGIIGLISKDFLILVVISFIVASPLAWYFINKWLQNFAYKAPFTIWIILLGCLTALLIAFLTISSQAIKAALSNPVKSLRTE